MGICGGLIGLDGKVLRFRELDIVLIGSSRDAVGFQGSGFAGLHPVGAYGSFRKLGVPSFGVLIIRILLFRVLY